MSAPDSHEASSRKGKSFAANLLVALMSVVVVLVILEIAARLLLPDRSESNTKLFRPDAELGWVAIPNLDLSWKEAAGGREVLVKTNSLGLRDREITPEQEAGGQRVLVFGDSITFGFGVQAEETFTKALEERLQRSSNIEVINAGCYGYGLDQYLLRYRQLAEVVQHSVVMVCLYIGNDVENTMMTACYGKPKPAFILEGEKLRLVGSPISDFSSRPDRFSPMFEELNGLFLSEQKSAPRDKEDAFAVRGLRVLIDYSTLARLVASRLPIAGLSAPSEGVIGSGSEARVGWVANHFYVYDGGWKYSKEWRPSQRAALKLVGALLEAFQAEAPELIVALIPARAQLDPAWRQEYTEAAKRIGLSDADLDFSEPSALLSSVCEEHGIPYINLWDALSTEKDPSALFLKDDPHYSPKGHAVLAGAIEQGLSALGWPSDRP